MDPAVSGPSPDGWGVDDATLLRVARAARNQSQRRCSDAIRALGGSGEQQAVSGWEKGRVPDNQQTIDAVRRYVAESGLPELVDRLLRPDDNPHLRSADILHLPQPTGPEALDDDSDFGHGLADPATASAIDQRIANGPAMSEWDWKAIELRRRS